MKVISATTLADFILTSYCETHQISPMKLQKLAYYAKVWGIVADYDFTDAKFEHWDHGPVNTQIFHRYREYSRSFIREPKEYVRLSSDQEEFIHFVLDSYVSMSATALSLQTHREDPWLNTPQNWYIDEAAIKEFYSKQNFAKNFEKKNYKEGPFFVVKTNSWHSFTMDMDNDESSYYESFRSFEEFQSATEKNEADFDEFAKQMISKMPNFS